MRGHTKFNEVALLFIPLLLLGPIMQAFLYKFRLCRIAAVQNVVLNLSY